LREKVDGHSDTITLIETTKGVLFGAYAVCSWDSSCQWNRDDSMESFILTPMNLHGVGARIFRIWRRQKKVRWM
jgi:hypothetical protein